MVTLFGSLIGPDTLVSSQTDGDGHISTQLAGVRVLFDETPAPLVYVYSSYLAAIVPYSTFGKAASAVRVEYMGAQSAPVIVPVALSAPGVFTADASGAGAAVALNEDGSLNSDSNPAQAGSIITLWATGEGQTTSDGTAPILPVTVQIDGIDSDATYSEGAGLLQIAARIPQNVIVSGNAVPVTVTILVGTSISQANVKVAVAGGKGTPGNQWFVSATGRAAARWHTERSARFGHCAHGRRGEHSSGRHRSGCAAAHIAR